MADYSVQTELKWRTLTPAINEIKPANSFLFKKLYPRHKTIETETIDLSFKIRGRMMAPLVRRGAEGVLVAGHSTSYATVVAPNIRIKHPFTANNLLFDRRPGYSLHPTAQQQRAALQEVIATDLQAMVDDISNREEWMCAMALQGEISYAVSDNDTFKVTYPIPAANQVTLSTFWNTTPSTTDLIGDFLTAKKLLSDEVGLVPTDVILGSEAIDAFLDCVQAQKNAATGTVLLEGQVNLAAQYQQDGAILLGNYSGLNVWGYPRTIVENDGTTVPLIRAKYAEFVCNNDMSERVMYYAAIPDMDAVEGNNTVTEKFTKTYKEDDPSQVTYLTHTRPLPVPRRAGATVSMKVVSG